MGGMAKPAIFGVGVHKVIMGGVRDSANSYRLKHQRAIRNATATL